MKLQGAGGQNVQHPMFVADGSITTGGTAQLVLGRSIARSFLLLQNTSQGPMYAEIGAARATCTISGGIVNSVTVTNAGMNYSRAPKIQFRGGGGNDGPFANSAYVGLGQPNAASAHNRATAHCVMTGSAPNMSVSSIVIDTGGANYLAAPYVFLHDDGLDPNGVAVPSNGVGIYLPAGAPPLVWNGTFATTDAVSIWGPTTGQTFVCRWAD